MNIDPNETAASYLFVALIHYWSNLSMRLTRLIIYIALLAAGGLHCPVGTRHYVKNGALQLIAFAIDVSLCRLSTCEYLARYSLYT